MYRNCPEHSAVALTLQTGYPTPENHTHKACDCSAELAPGEPIYEIDGELYCEECFKDWIKDYLATNPRELADMLCVDNRLYQEGA